MSGLIKREFFPFARPLSLIGGMWAPDELIRVDELHDDGFLVIRAEIPGIDPDEDVELTVADGVLHLLAKRHEEDSEQAKGYTRKEIRTGSFQRTLPLPAGVTGADVTATYKDGILEIRIPEPEPQTPTRIPVTKG